MKKCPICKKEYDENLEVCPRCAEIENANNESHFSKNLISQSFLERIFKKVMSKCKSNKILSNKRIIIPTAAVLLLFIATITFFATSNIRIISKAQSFLDKGDCIAAWNIVESLDEKHADEIKTNIHNSMKEEIENYISAKNIKSAKETLEKYSMLDSDTISKLKKKMYSACKHSLDIKEEKSATCEVSGIKIEVCKTCGYEKKTEEKPLSHEYNDEITKEPTCSEPGSKTATCSKCGKVITEVISPKEHDYDENIIKEATCKEPGEKNITCKVCGQSTTESLPILTDHKYVKQIISEATCTSEGEEREVCEICGDVGSVQTYLGEHSYTDATCTQPAKCIYCGKTSGSATGHSWTDATCTEPKSCIYCGETIGSATGHSWTDATVYSPKTCKNCGATEGSPLQGITLIVRTALPFTLTEYTYSGTVKQKAQITSVTYDIDRVNSDGTYKINLYFSGEKTYDYEGSHMSRYVTVPYKIYDSDGYLITGGNLLKSSVGTGDKFKDEKEYLYTYFTPGTYYLDLLNADN